MIELGTIGKRCLNQCRLILDLNKLALLHFLFLQLIFELLYFVPNRHVTSETFLKGIYFLQSLQVVFLNQGVSLRIQYLSCFLNLLFPLLFLD